MELLQIKPFVPPSSAPTGIGAVRRLDVAVEEKTGRKDVCAPQVSEFAKLVARRERRGLGQAFESPHPHGEDDVVAGDGLTRCVNARHRVVFHLDALDARVEL